MYNIDKKRTFEILHKCIILYDKNLKNYNIMFIIENKKFKSIKDRIDFIETIFYSHNFLHLTGLDYIPENQKIKTNYNKAIEFYQKLLKGKVPLNSIKYKNPITTELKLDILHNLCAIDRSAKLIGNYNGIIKDNLYTEKVVGNMSYCFGLIKDNKSNYFYLPNSAIKENIKNITNDTCNIVAIFKKEKNEKFYSNITYIKKNFNLNHIFSNEDLINKLDLKNIKFTNKEDIKNYKKVEEFRNCHI